jgi:hypothetical protein
MKHHFLGAVLLLLACAAFGMDNPVTNGGFEALDPAYFPRDWSAVGPGVGVSTEAHTGRYALRVNRMATKPMPPETGLNRAWSPNAGRGAMLEQRRGILRAWVKVRSASPDASIVLVVIPMGDPGYENTGEMRAMRNVSPSLAGDGRWHELRLAYDYSASPKVRWVHVGVRITGGAADVLWDDFELLEGEASILQVEKVHVYPDRARPDAAAMLTAAVANDGTAPSGPVALTLYLPEGVTADGPTEIRSLAPGDGKTVRWTLRGKLKPGMIRIGAATAADRAEGSISLAPRLEIVSGLAKPGIVAPGSFSTIAITIWNRGTAPSEPTKVNLKPFGGLKAASVSVPTIAPGRRAVRTVRTQVMSGPGTSPGADLVLVGADSAADHHRIVFEVTDAVQRPAQPLLPGVSIRRGSDRTMADLALAGRSAGAPLARMPHLGRLTVRFPNGHAQTLTARFGSAQRKGAGWILQASERDSAGGTWTFTAGFARLSAQAVRCTLEAQCTQARKVIFFEGPTLLVGEGGIGSAKDEAIFPGLEWLIGDEVSSSDLDILASHPDRIRYAPHPNKVTIPAMSVAGPAGTAALLWDALDKWDGMHDRPQPVFASPDRIGGSASHRMGLVAPSPVASEAAGTQGTFREAPWSRDAAIRDRAAGTMLPAGRKLRLSGVIYLAGPGTEALRGVEEWFAWFRPLPPAPAPRGSDEAQVAWSMQAYLKTLWDTPQTGWFPYLLGPAIWRHPSLNPGYAYDLLQAARVLPAHPDRARWIEKLKEAGFAADAEVQSGGGTSRMPTADDMQFGEGDPISYLVSLGTSVIPLMALQQADGSYRFDADKRDTGVFRGYDFHELGEPGAVEVGLMAFNAYQMLQIARISGDRAYYDAAVRTLRKMEAYRVPRAAQVWEVPVHTPDILAAADCVDAYLEAYWFSGERLWLERAKLWARRGLPFVYVWNAPGKLWMRYGSIPVFGASQMRGSWFGNLVQWNGIRYALSLLKLYSLDRAARYAGLSWRDIAIGITRSAMYQQSLKPEFLGTWPDSLHTITDVRAAWEFAPRQILKNVFWWMGRPEMPMTYRVKTSGGAVLRVTGLGTISDLRYDGGSLMFRVAHPARSRGSVLVSGVTEPQRVLVNGVEAQRVRHNLTAGQLQWRYDLRLRAVGVHIPNDGSTAVKIEGIAPATPRLLSAPVDRIAFEFANDDEGWTPQHDVDELSVVDGALTGKSTGGDPYLVRSNCTVAGGSIREIILRMRADGHGGGQFYWTTAASPVFDELKVMPFVCPPDGQWHEVTLPVGTHPMWRGQTITGLRIDPVNAANVSFAIDWVRSR